MSKKKDVLLDHDYDGIHELDNDLPPWWLYLFYFSIIFAVVYMLDYHVFHLSGLSADEYQMEINPNYTPSNRAGMNNPFRFYHSPWNTDKEDVTPYIQKKYLSYTGPQNSSEALIVEAMRRSEGETLEKLKDAFPEMWDYLQRSGVNASAQPAALATAAAEEEIEEVEPLTDAASIKAGHEIFSKNCISCHGPQGQGGIGPNLTDDYWLHGSDISHIANTITRGVPSKGMITWRGVLSKKQIHQVASFILTLHGTNPPNAKAPQGTLAAE